jgi:hypothetical protein
MMSNAPRTPRSVVNMPAVASKPVAAAARKNVVKDTVLISALVLAVTAGGVAVGALGIAPLLRNASMRQLESAARSAAGFVLQLADVIVASPKAVTIAGIALAVSIALVLSYRAYRTSGGKETIRVRRRRQSQSTSAPHYASRTPRDVQVLAAAGQAPVDIAIRTRLSVDAVSMLLQLRQAEAVSTAR